MLRKYETLFIIDAELEEESTQALVEKFKNMIETSGKLESIDEWGKRRMAYPVDDKNEGYYVMATFSADPEFPSELERIFKITDGIVKSLVINKDK